MFRSGVRFLASLAAQGRSSFTSAEALAAFQTNETAVQAVLRRLRVKREIATPLRGLHLILSPPHRQLGCLPPTWFVDALAHHLGLPYYVALLSAAELHNAAHQRPQSFQVMLPRSHRPIRCGGVRIEFVMRRELAWVPTELRNTPTGTLRVSSPEATALDLVGYPERCGGPDAIAAVLVELAEVMRPERLVTTALVYPMPWLQRLGWLLERVGAGKLADAAAKLIDDSAPAWTPLDPARAVDGATRDTRWKLWVNTEVEVER